MRVLVIGGTGFVSSSIVRELIGREHRVACLTRGTAGRPPPPEGVLSLRADRTRMRERRAELGRFRPDVVVDAIAQTQAEADDTAAVLRGLTERIVVVSSCDVYQAYGAIIGIERPIVPGPVREGSALRTALFPYRLRGAEDAPTDYEKILVERAYAQVWGPRAAVVRLPMVYGPGDPQHRWRPYVDRMRPDRPAIVLAEGLAGWRASRGFVEDVGRAVALVAETTSASGVYNVAEAAARTEADWVGHIAALLDWRGSVRRVREANLPDLLRPPFDVRQDLVIASERIRRELGFSELGSRADALRQTVEWERGQPRAAGAMSAVNRAEDDPALRGQDVRRAPLGAPRSVRE